MRTKDVYKIVSMSKNKYANWRWLGLGVICWVFVAQAQTQTKEPSVLHPLGDTFKVPHLLSKSQSRVVFYRQASDLGDTGVASVYVNGRYHASLQSGAFSEVCVPPKKVNVTAVMERSGGTVPDVMDIENTLLLSPGQDVFVRVGQQPNGRAVLMMVRPEAALPELVKLRAQQHTMTRVADAAPCQEDASRLQAAGASNYTITLEADALFPFGQSDVQTLSPRGRRMLDHLVDRIKSEFGSGNRVRIQIWGHADSFGSAASNLKVSKARAAAIKSYFVQGGLMPESIKADGRGDQQRVITTCSTKLSAESVACNKPNRRVVVNVWGTLTPQPSN